MTAIWMFLKSVPLWVWFVLGLLVAGGIYGENRYNSGETAGKAEVQKKYDAHLAADAAATQKANAEYRAKEAKQAEALAEIGFRYEREKMEALDEKDRIIAGLRAGTLRMQDRWSCPTSLPDPATGVAVTDAGTADRQESAGRIVQAALECDAQVRGLQDVVRTDRGD